MADIAKEVAQPADPDLVATGFRCLGQPACAKGRLA
jgi:hypothetical protein